MRVPRNNAPIVLRMLDTPDEMAGIENLQRLIWPGNETEIVPGHLLITAAHNGGLVIGAYSGSTGSLHTSSEAPVILTVEENSPNAKLVGFVFGFPGIYDTADGPRLKHCSHMLGVIPEVRDQGIGFLLKRAQWQMVRQQGVDRITWTYDPLLSRNAYLNISRLGAVSSTYINNAYGEMRDELNAGLPSDRLQVDWWVNTTRVTRRLSRKARRPLNLAQYLAAGAEILNPTFGDVKEIEPSALQTSISLLASRERTPLVMLEIPSDYQSSRNVDPDLAYRWRLLLRVVFHELFLLEYIVTDFIYLPGEIARSFYVFSHGEATL